jgi:hypothetical protein
VSTRHTFEFDQAGQIMVEQFVDDDGNTTQVAMAVRTDQWDIWSPPVIGEQTS